MAGNNQGGEGLGDDFFEQMLSVPGFGGAAGGGGSGEVVGFGLGVGGSGGGASDHHHHHQQQLHGSMVLGLGTGDGSGHGLGGVGGYRGMGIPLGLNLDPSSAAGSFLKAEDMSADASASSSSSRLLDGDSLHLTSLFPAFAHMQTQPLRAPPPQVQLQQPFQSQAAPPPSLNAVSHPPNIRPRVRARRGQATDPHSIAERQRRERIAERMKALQELVPSCNKTDRAAMLDEIVDYVKFLRLQVKVLSMSRLGGGAVAQLVADVPPPTAEGGEGSMEGGQPVWDRWSNDGTEQQVAKLMEEDVGSAMQFLQSKELCIMPMSLASALFRAHPPDAPNMVKPETNHPQ